jgi:hypothetical protein
MGTRSFGEGNSSECPHFLSAKVQRAYCATTTNAAGPPWRCQYANYKDARERYRRSMGFLAHPLARTRPNRSRWTQPTHQGTVGILDTGGAARGYDDCAVG